MTFVTKDVVRLFADDRSVGCSQPFEYLQLLLDKKALAVINSYFANRQTVLLPGFVEIKEA
ncbi:hypothetical protein MCOR25_009277 [Pyricularia grisea]|nr:hypothetical protein MCOR25_009277 [Pyricularia grisea]